MQLVNLLKDDYPLPLDADRIVTGLTLDSRHVERGNLFFAIKGKHVDGREYIQKAISQGATAIVMEAKIPRESLQWQSNVPLIPIFQLQARLGFIASRYYGMPGDALCMLGVTGTSGKTSCTHFLAESLQMMNIPTGIIGTLGNGFYGALNETGLTTPDAITLQATLYQLAQQQAKAVAMEVSSHSIDQGRINGISFDIGIFTNLSQDHLDYHGDMETYAKVKYRFLADKQTKKVIINADDVYGKKWINDLSKDKYVAAYGLKKENSISEYLPFTSVSSVELTLQGIKARVHSPWGEGELISPLIGQFNLSNSLALLTALCTYGIEFSDALHCLAQLKPVSGRMQTLGGKDKPLVVVDYAHKPDALEKVLQALRAHTEGKLICVFGCGGERDRGKRPIMAKIAETIADKVIITNDNPRHEKPEDIVAEILSGFTHKDRVSVELDRSKAIKNSIQCALAKDCVLIAGKGAERYQQIGDEKFPFNDVEEVNKHLSKSSILL